MRRFSALLIVLLAACSSTDYDSPQDRAPMRGERMRTREAGPMLLDMLPADSWWREPRIAEPLNLTNDQFTALDRILTDHSDDIARIERDLPVAQRDLRASLTANTASAADINAAAQRVREIRNSLFDRQVQMLTAERLVLTNDQWTKLLDALRQQRDERMDRGGYDRGGYPGRGGRGGRGGYPGGGRRPWPY